MIFCFTEKNDRVIKLFNTIYFRMNFIFKTVKEKNIVFFVINCKKTFTFVF